MIYIKKIIIFVVILIMLFLPSLIRVDYTFYDSLALPFFTPPNIFFSIAWSIVYICLAISVSMVLDSYPSIKDVPSSYKKALIINYLFTSSFTTVFFVLKSTFLGFVSSLGTFISCLFLYEETSKLNESADKFLNPYVLLSLFGTVLSLSIYIMNL